MPELSVHKKQYVIVNIWTSDRNKALPGPNVGHISFTTSTGHGSLWPGGVQVAIPYKRNTTKQGKVKFFASAPDYVEDYEQDCMRETISESGEYEFRLMGYELCLLTEEESIEKKTIEENKIYMELINAYSPSLMQKNVALVKGSLYFELLEDGSLSYTAITPSNQRVEGSLNKETIENISSELASLEAPLNETKLELIKAFYPEIVDMMSEAHRELIANLLIQYTVKAPSGQVVKAIIQDDIQLKNGRKLVDVLFERVDANVLQTFLPYILEITSQRGHTRTDLQAPVIESRKIYFDLTEDGSLLYVVKSSKETVRGSIDKSELIKINQQLANLTAPLTLSQLALLERFKPEILNLTAQKGHTKEVRFRPAYRGMALLPGEVFYRFDSTDNTYQPVTEVPPHYLPQYSFFAVKLLHANFRVVLYSLNAEKVNQKFKALQQPDAVIGWTMQGSNLFTRNYRNETTESCASLAFRCLESGGFYSALKSKTSSQTSSIVTPDDLLRHVVAYKEKELQSCPESASWETDGIDISSFENAKVAYGKEGLNANAEDDIIPSLMPTIPRCVVQ
ncbi:hypothetical protein [Legionella saoudiensis]|uniref:hypothetical protein n=1 Tax=Legionella saoudiensis TaxID=1750561 RepID=UPI0007315002|nr:hypothetical protein [Legionella saoudiensis]